MTADVLVAQKDRMLRKVQSGRLDEIQFVVNELVTYFDRWIEDNYHYKGKEICELILRDLHGRHTTQRVKNMADAAEALRVRFRKAEQAWKAMALPPSNLDNVLTMSNAQLAG